VVAGALLASDREAAFQQHEENMSRMGDISPETRMAVQQLPWGFVFDLILSASPAVAEVVDAVNVLRRNFPDNLAASEPPPRRA
jgi:hypothetical protein